MTEPPDAAPRGRLQRPPDFTGQRLESFRAVFLRHGLPGALLGLTALIIVVAYPTFRPLLAEALQPALADPLRYVVGAVLLLCGFAAYAWRRGCWQGAKLGWTLYLGGLSLWEEWVFRLALPYGAAALGVDLLVAAVVANMAFGGLHYFTLRWKWHWCLLAALGGLALSRHFHQHFDLLWITALHWVGTFVNTPRPPSTVPDNHAASANAGGSAPPN